MMSVTQNRRAIVSGLIGLGGSLTLAGRATAAALTPSATEGPYYPTETMRFADIDNDLVKIVGRVQEAGGEIMTLHGRVTDRAQQPLAGHRVEIWQCDLNGKYLHPGDRRDLAHDQGFQGFGHDITDHEGRYTFRTIKPGKYPGRTPHIHVKVFDPQGRELLTTQFYEADNRDNAGDSLFRRLSQEEAQSVSMTYETHDGVVSAQVDILV